MSGFFGSLGSLATGVGMMGGTKMGASLGIGTGAGLGLMAGGAVAGVVSNYFDWDSSQDAIDKAIKRTKAMRSKAIGAQKENTSYQRTTNDELMSRYAMSDDGKGEGYKSLYSDSQNKTNSSVQQEQSIATMYDNAISQLKASKSDFDWFGNSSEAAYNTIEGYKGLVDNKAMREQQEKTAATRKNYDALLNKQIEALSAEYDRKSSPDPEGKVDHTYMYAMPQDKKKKTSSGYDYLSYYKTLDPFYVQK